MLVTANIHFVIYFIADFLPEEFRHLAIVNALEKQSFNSYNFPHSCHKSCFWPLLTSH